VVDSIEALRSASILTSDPTTPFLNQPCPEQTEHTECPDLFYPRQRTVIQVNARVNGRGGKLTCSRRTISPRPILDVRRGCPEKAHWSRAHLESGLEGRPAAGGYCLGLGTGSTGRNCSAGSQIGSEEESQRLAHKRELDLLLMAGRTKNANATTES
jgi:hypothetical protein